MPVGMKALWLPPEVSVSPLSPATRATSLTEISIRFWADHYTLPSLLDWLYPPPMSVTLGDMRVSQKSAAFRCAFVSFHRLPQRLGRNACQNSLAGFKLLRHRHAHFPPSPSPSPLLAWPGCSPFPVCHMWGDMRILLRRVQLCFQLLSALTSSFWTTRLYQFSTWFQAKRKCWMDNVEDRMSRPMPEPLRMRFSAELSLIMLPFLPPSTSPPPPHTHTDVRISWGSELNWNESSCKLVTLHQSSLPHEAIRIVIQHV